MPYSSLWPENGCMQPPWRGFLCSLMAWKRDLHDVHNCCLPSLFMLLGWSSTWIASTQILSMKWGMVKIILVSQSKMCNRCVFYTCFGKLSNPDWYIVHNCSLQSQSPSQGKGSWRFWVPHNTFNVASVQHPANVVEGYTHVRWDSNRAWILPRPNYTLWWMVGMTNLFLVVCTLPENGPQELQLIHECSEALCTKDRILCLLKGGGIRSS